MNILITGGSGFLGSEITNLLSKNNNIYIYDINKNKNKNKKNHILCKRKY